ncbi:MAG: hypothetical protein JO043_02735 [Candidatus Eremiobacteraeota bacterium]|nr:hypothetical protein [Candidatus Eremiobacteraeota bacterium]
MPSRLVHRFRLGKMTNLREDRIHVDEGSNWYLHAPFAQGVAPRQIEQRVRSAPDIARRAGARTEPLTAVRIVVCPALFHPATGEDLFGIAEPKARVLRHLGGLGIVTAFVVVPTVLQEVHIVTELHQTD